MSFNSSNGLVPEYLTSKSVVTRNESNYAPRDSVNQLVVPIPRTNYLKNSFSYSGTTLWKSLPCINIREFGSLTQIRRASDISRNAALKPKPKQQTDTVPFVITYNPALPNISRIIHKHSNVLYSSAGRCKNVFTNLPLVAYRRCHNISDILVRAKLPEPTDQSRSPSCSFRCNKTSCTVCPFIEDGRNQYTFYSTGQTFKIKSHITCETFNVMYMIQCTNCNLQYIGETKRRIKDRFNEHRRLISEFGVPAVNLKIACDWERIGITIHTYMIC